MFSRFPQIAVVFMSVFLAGTMDAACGDDTLPVIDVVGNALGVRYSNGTFTARQFRGVTGTGAEYACVQGWGMFDGTTAVSPYMTGMQSWTVGIVRVPLNEDCWLGINGVNPQYAGENYQNAIAEYVQTLNDNGFYVILDLHWSAPGTTLATGQNPMPDLDHSPAFWASVGSTFGSNGCVIFDLFNEPYPDNNSENSTAAWECWKYGSVGGNCSSVPYAAVGMDDLVAVVRAPNVSATNVLMLGGINYANSLWQWLEYVPSDPLNKLVASWHSYNFNACVNQDCWERSIGTVAAQYPVVTGELGENDCGGNYITPLMNFLDSLQNGGAGTSYLAWVYADWNCDSGPALITSYDNNGQCTNNYGCTYQSHIQARASSP
jgi:endoglucanase